MRGHWYICKRCLRALGIIGLLLIALTIVAPGTQAADFAVSPMVLEFGRGIRSAEIQLQNLDQQPIRFQVRGTDWSQDENGKNVYADSRSLIWFPRALEIAPGEKRIIRVGVKTLPASEEQAYTVFLREVALGGAQAGKGTGAQVRLLLSVAVPVFVPPLKPESGGTIESVELRGGILSVMVANEGNQHFNYRQALIVGLEPDRAEKFRQKVAGKTLLAGSRYHFKVKIPKEACRQLSELMVTLTTPKQTEIKRGLNVSRADCQ